MTLYTRPERRDTTTPRSDEPDAAADSELPRRQPTDGRLDMPRSYEAATRHVASLARFSSTIGRDFPVAQPFGLADGFVSRGFATLCFDKRGLGQSTGQYINAISLNSNAIFEDLASDMVAGVEFLRSRPEIDHNRIGLSGVSEAGWIVPPAAQKSNAAYMLLIVAPTVSVGIENFYRSIVEFTNAPLEDGYKQFPSFNSFPGLDPKPVLESLSIPGLWLLSGEDPSIPTPATAAILDQLIASGKPYTHVVFPEVGHNLPPGWPDIDQWLAKHHLRPWLMS